MKPFLQPTPNPHLTQSFDLKQESLPQLDVSPEIARVHTVIIGGGPAGLACMRRLQDQSPEHSAILLEASHSIGGRVRGALMGDPLQVSREGGAEFAYQDLVEALTGIGVNVSPSELIPVAPYGKKAVCVFHQGEIVAAEKFFEALDPDEIRNNLFLEMKKFGTDISIAEFLNHHSEVYQTLRRSNPGVAATIWQNLIGEYACQSLDQMGIAVCADQAEENGESSHHNTLSGNVFRVKNGYASLIEKVGEGLDIRRGMSVEKIETLADGDLQVYARASNINRTLKFIADHVVLAVPVPTLKNIELPAGIDYLERIQRQTKGTFGIGRIVKVIFKSTEPLLPDGKQSLIMSDRPVEVWQRKIEAGNYQCTLWIAGPAATEFEQRAGLAEPGENLSSALSPRRRGESAAHAIVRDTICEIFGEGSDQSITRMSIIPWDQMKYAGHAYRLALPSGLPFDHLEQPQHIALAPGLFLTGADINLATVPSALKSGAATADFITMTGTSA